MKSSKVRSLGAITLGISAMAASMIGLSSCGGGSSNTFMIWGPEEHRDMYLKLGEDFKAANPDFKGDFAYAANGDAGAYSNMSIDPQAGGSIYTFANDMLNNLNRLGAIAPVKGENLTWAKTKNTDASVEAGKIGENYYAYPVQADNGYYMYYRKDVFQGTSLWDTTTNTFKDGYTFRDLYNAIDEKAATDTSLENAVATWAIGDSWYTSGAFFAVGGDYDVTYDEDGNQKTADCWFAYKDGYHDDSESTCKIGINATYGLINSITDAPATGTKGTILNKHYMFSDGDKSPLNDNITKYASKDATKNGGKPLVACVCGTWKAKELQGFWGDDYAATYLPALETPEGKFQMKNFCGFKLMGVNPLSSFCTKSEENLAWAHKVAQFMSDKDSQLSRYAITGAGPSNKEALLDDAVKGDLALKALNAQYDHPCTYPGTEGEAIGNGLGYRVQDSVPANYWTPIQVFGTSVYNEVQSGNFDKFRTDGQIRKTVLQLQKDVAAAAK